MYLYHIQMVIFGANTFTLANSQNIVNLFIDNNNSDNSNSIISDNNNNNNIEKMNTIFANQLLQHLNEKLQFAGLYSNNSNNINLIHNNNNNNNLTTKIINNSGIIDPILHQELMKNQIIINGSEFADETWRKQIEYDKFMNEIWIGVVLTLIIISLVFCVCSCFLYHQFRQWQLNYRHNIERNNHDIESVKLNIEDDDPVPQYTLVSGLPSYETALDMLQKSTQKSCIIVYPSVFNIFTKNEKDDQLAPPSSGATSTTELMYCKRKNSIEKLITITTPPNYDEINSQNVLAISQQDDDDHDDENSELNDNTNNSSEALLDNTNLHKNS